MKLPGTEPVAGRFGFSVWNKDKLKGYAWTWNERINPKKPRVPNPGVLAVRVANLGHKDAMIAADPVKFFTEPHYNGYPAVLVRLGAVTVADLRVLLKEAWLCTAPKQPTDGVTKRAPTTRRPATARKRKRS